ncbi:serine/threonine-protein phosphatase 7 long form homolog [Vicia villosa]|uniref:serine/threonine-protein phosphatase 7 long form homolog n=1 Tax=Vicia villosa TaxID=3911 RepID=UPI00273B9256|nr:serine/threonine-protein phosphatase 7 long form homolog [Vicia villosa]
MSNNVFNLQRGILLNETCDVVTDDVWGSAVLSYLYREICKSVDVDVDGMGGCVELLQAWGYTRMPFIAPITPMLPSYPYASRWAAKKKKISGHPRYHLVGYRSRIDHMVHGNFIWRPYINLPPLDNDDHTIWNATTPMICFWIIEWQQSDRVKLQFELHQEIPGKPHCLKEHHDMTMKESWKTPYTQLYWR